MTTDRAYRPAMSDPEALAELERCAGTQFDPRVVAALQTVVSTSRLEVARIDTAVGALT
jgi:HD-GYP domain-containing protein (c-di-GMP phosphodiesterase class II)